MVNPLVSIIITTKNSEDILKACLDSIKNQTYENIEIIVVDNNSSDSSKVLAFNYTNKVYNMGPERSAQRNYGVSKSLGNFIIILDSDMVLNEKVIESCVIKIQENENIKGIVIPEESFGEGFWARCKKLERSFYVGMEWMEAARFFNKNISIELGGYDIKNTGTEDYDLPHRIKHKYGENSIGRIEYHINHNEQKLSLKETLKKKFYYTKTLNIYKEKSHNRNFYKKQSSLFKRYKLFFSQPKKLLHHPFLGIGMIFMKTCEFFFGGLGYLVQKIKKRSNWHEP